MRTPRRFSIPFSHVRTTFFTTFFWPLFGEVGRGRTPYGNRHSLSPTRPQFSSPLPCPLITRIGAWVVLLDRSSPSPPWTLSSTLQTPPLGLPSRDKTRRPEIVASFTFFPKKKRSPLLRAPLATDEWMHSCLYSSFHNLRCFFPRAAFHSSIYGRPSLRPARCFSLTNGRCPRPGVRL